MDHHDQQPLIKPYARTPRQERVFNADDLSRRLEAFTVLHDTNANAKTLPQRRQSNAAFVPRNAGRAFQSTTTIRAETTKEAKRKTLPPQGFTWGADTPQSASDGFSCAQLAYAHNQLQAYSDELRAKHSPRVPNETDEDDEPASENPKDALRKIPRRAEDRPNWTQESDDDGEYNAINRLAAGAARALRLSRAEESEREEEAIRRTPSHGGFLQSGSSRPELTTRRSSHGDLPSKHGSLAYLGEQDEEDLMHYVRTLPRKQPEAKPTAKAPTRKAVQGDATQAAVDSAKRARKQASATNLQRQPTQKERPRSMIFENGILNSLGRIRSSSKTSAQYSPVTSTFNDATATPLHSSFSKSSLTRLSNDDAQTLNDREREEKALRRRTLQPDFSPPSRVNKRSSWAEFTNGYRAADPAYRDMEPASPTRPSAQAQDVNSELSTRPHRAPSKTMQIAQAAKKLHEEELERKRQELRQSQPPTPTVTKRSSWMGYANGQRSVESDSLSLQRPQDVPQLTRQDTGSTTASRTQPTRTPSRTMLTAQAAKKLHQEELEQKRRELQESQPTPVVNKRSSWTSFASNHRAAEPISTNIGSTPASRPQPARISSKSSIIGQPTNQSREEELGVRRRESQNNQHHPVINKRSSWMEFKRNFRSADSSTSVNMPVTQAAFNPYDEELERKKRDLEEIRQQEERDERKRKEDSNLVGLAPTTIEPSTTSPPLTAGIGWISAAPINAAPARVVKDPIPTKNIGALPQKERKSGGLRRWFSKTFGSGGK